MTDIPYENEKAKRDFLEQLLGARGFTKGSILVFAGAIAKWQLFTGNEDFANFNKMKATAFVEWLETKSSKTPTGKIAIVTRYNYLRRVKKFFEWLSDQPGYKSKMAKGDIEYLRLSKKDTRIARQSTTKKIPTFEEIRKLIEGIEIKNEIDMRDRALICFAFTVGARISAIITLKMKSFDKQEKVIDQNPADGVKTKSSKRILCTFFPLGWDDPERYFVEWYEYLESKSFGPDDPIFPTTQNDLETGESAYSRGTIGTDFWSSSGSARKILQKRYLSAGMPYYHPHSFRNLAVAIVSKKRLTEEEKKAVSLNLGHEDVATTFGSYGYGNMTANEAIRIVKSLKNSQGEHKDGSLTEEELRVFRDILARNK
ncbi:MAG: site-specific integrase [bacterium]